MAEITTHIFFSIDIQNKIKSSSLIKLFPLGPDVFYFSKKTYSIAYKMHRKNTLLFFKNYIKYIKDNKLENNDYVVGSLYGFLTHYVLDYMVHPYIFYKGGLNNGMHRVYEMSLTKYVLNEHGINPVKYKISEYINTNENEDVIKLLDYVLYKTYGVSSGGKLYYKCVKRVKRTYMLFRYDRFGIKKFFYKIIDLFYKKKLSSASYYNIEDVSFNLEHNTWYHPCSYKKSNKSLLDLYSESYKIIYKVIKNVNLVLNNKKDIDELDNIIENRSLINGLDSNERHVMKYFEK